MADRTLTERLQPSILDRLTDDDPQNTSETPSDRAIDIRRLREIIQRDLAWLLNTGNLESQIDAEKYPNVMRSVINYGVPDSTGDFANDERAQGVRNAIKKAVELFEPRLIDGTLSVVSREDEKKGEAIIVFDIIGDMWAEPVPAELYLRSQFDMTTGHLSLEHGG